MDDLKNDIEKYLKGELSPSEMHALEKKALDDPFLEDALEGSSQIPTEALEADLRMLESTLGLKTKPSGTKAVPMWVWPMRIAAGLVLIAISTFVIIQFTGNKPSEDLALKTDSIAAPKLEVQAPAQADSVAKPGDSYLSLAKPESPESSKEREYSAQEPKEETANGVDADEQAGQESVAPSPGVADAPKTEEVHAAAEIIVEEKIAQATPEQPRARTFRKEDAKKLSQTESEKDNSIVAGAAASRSADDARTNSKVIRGKVIGEDGTGLPGVNVTIKGSNVGTVTDALGNYQIPVSPENPNLLFTFIGYMNTEVNAAGKDEVDIQMSEDVAQLSEVVVVGYGDGPMDARPTEPLELAEPAGGRRAFKQYLEQNLRYPEQALSNNVEGKVTIMFTVETSGQLSDFRVLRGIGNGCDEEVIRLIKEGPKWSPSKRKDDAIRDKVKVRMRFALPKNKK